MVKLAALFNPYAREMRETYYRYNQDYNFPAAINSKTLPDFSITSYRDGVTEIIKNQELKLFPVIPHPIQYQGGLLYSAYW